MLKSIKIDIDENLYNEIVQYCKLNNIKNVKKEISRFALIGFNIDRYGEKPFAKFHKVENLKNTTVQNEETHADTPTKTVDEGDNESKEVKVPKTIKRSVRIIKN